MKSLTFWTTAVICLVPKGNHGVSAMWFKGLVFWDGEVAGINSPAKACANAESARGCQGKLHRDPRQLQRCMDKATA